MQTNIHPVYQSIPVVQEAEDILRNCVHCGFCTATCPTYQLLGDELDGPRGRIYLISQLLETADISVKAQSHLDKCLTCRSCETTCPSGVKYGRLLDIGRGLIAAQPTRFGVLERTRSKLSLLETVGCAAERALKSISTGLLRLVIPRRYLLNPLLAAGQFIRPVLPATIRMKIPLKSQTHYPARVIRSPKQRVLVLGGCVQKAATPQVNEALSYLLSLHDVATEFLTEESCCGALDYHLSAHESGMARMRRLIAQIKPRIDSVDYIVSTASGCGVTIKDYPEIFAHEPDLADITEVVGKVVDVSELLARFDFQAKSIVVGIHVPCSLQHGQKLPGQVEGVLKKAGLTLALPDESHLCCGSAGTYSILQPAIATQLRDRKLANLTSASPDVIATANIGCQMYLQTGTALAVKHWVEVLADQVVGLAIEPPE